MFRKWKPYNTQVSDTFDYGYHFRFPMGAFVNSYLYGNVGFFVMGDILGFIYIYYIYQISSDC